MTQTKRLTLNGFEFNELFTTDGLSRLDTAFIHFLKKKNESLADELSLYRSNQLIHTAIERSEWLIALSIHLETFLADFFGIQEALAISQINTTSFHPIAIFKKYFVLKRAKKEMHRINTLDSYESLNTWLTNALSHATVTSDDKELAVALLGQTYLNDPEKYKEHIEKLVAWCTHVLVNKTVDWSSFHTPSRIEPGQLVACERVSGQHHIDHLKAPDDALRERDGFKLTDARMSERDVLDEVHYCIYCHDHEGDFCSKGFPVKKGDPTQGYKKNAQDLLLTGCPLEEKISEMQQLKRDGYTIASLAMIMIDNPMCPATGHRICNDCMKACIYQKQDPVNIPQIETRVLTDALHLPFGVELYDLLTRWHPLRETQWIMKPYNGLKILIAGMGPAGFTLAHHLLLEGFAVVGFDGLKIEPLPHDLITNPIASFDDICENLDERIMAGFGGVAEYGITVRWDKNFLKLIYLSLMRRPHFQVFGGIRFGGTITIESAFALGFDHVVVAVGAGLPKALRIPNSMAPNMRQANDFLMALQLGNAAKKTSLNTLAVRLPAVVIGGGLTGVDTATEVQAYYVTMVEKVLYRYETLTAIYGNDAIINAFDTNTRSVLLEYLSHANSIRQAKIDAAERGKKAALIPLLQQWGGVSIVYRKTMQQSPAYIYNHEELQNALKEGIFYIEKTEPVAATLDSHGFTESLIAKHSDHEQTYSIPAKSILVATGTQPNTAYEFEHKGTFHRIQLQYQHYEDIDGELHIAHGITHTKENDFGPFTSYHRDGHRVSLIGDTHPVFHGNVVKAIASGMRTYPKITALFKEKLATIGDVTEYHDFAHQLNAQFNTTITRIERKTNHIIELTVHAPLAAHQFKPGQFFRLQNLETTAVATEDTLLQMEALSLPAAECDPKTGLITFLIKEDTTSAKLVATLKEKEPISLMGPTGVRTKVSDEDETILMLGEPSSFAFVRSVGRAAIQSGNRVLFICQLNHQDDLFCQEKLEEATDQIIWVTSNDNIHITLRKHDEIIPNDSLLDALTNYHTHLSNPEKIAPKDVDRVFVLGASSLLKQFQHAQRALKQIFIKEPKMIGSVYGNMQCMLKGVCAQCLQWQIDPETGERTKAVFACSWQDQPLELIDIPHLETRQKPNQVLDTLNQLWLTHLFATKQIDRI